jgi:hypothetical protein
LDQVETTDVSRSDESTDWYAFVDELTRLALAADPNAPLSDDAVPWTPSPKATSPLPQWYMAPAMSIRRTSGTRLIVAAIILSFLAIDACGLCVTYGFLSIA